MAYQDPVKEHEFLRIGKRIFYVQRVFSDGNVIQEKKMVRLVEVQIIKVTEQPMNYLEELLMNKTIEPYNPAQLTNQ